MKKLKKILVLLVTVALMSSSLLVSADTNTNAASSNTQPNLNIVNVPGSEPESLDPQKATSVVAMDVGNRIMEGLMRRNGNNVIPGMASRYAVSKDGLTYTFYLRDAIWSDGKPVTANDFAYAWQRALDPKTGSDYAFLLYYIKNGEKFNTGKAASSLLGIKVIDDKTLQVTLENPTPYFIDLTANMVYYPVRKDLLEMYGNSYFDKAEQLASNGPFKLTAWEHDAYITVEKNSTYWNAKAIKIDVINTNMFSKGDNYKEDYLNGDIDAVKIAANDKASFPQNEIKKSFNGTVWYVEFNNSDKAKILTNSNIRKALTLAINRQQFINEAAVSSATPAFALVAPEIIPGKAKSFREEAGNLVKDNDIKSAKSALSLGLKQLKLKKLPAITLLVDSSNVAANQAASLANMWKKNLGIDIKVEQIDFKNRLEKMYSGNYQMVLAGWGPDYYDAMTYLEMFNSSVTSNSFGYKNTDFNNMITSIKKEADKSKRLDLLKKAEKKLIDEYVVAPLYFKYSEIACKPYLKNLQTSALGIEYDLTFAELVPGEKVFKTSDSKLTMKTNPYWYKDYDGTSGVEADLVILDSALEAGTAVIVAPSLGADSDLLGYYNLLVDNLKASYPNANFSQNIAMKIDGFNATNFRLTVVDNGDEVVFNFTLISTPNKIYNIMQWTNGSTAFEQRKAEFDKMVNSIKIAR